MKYKKNLILYLILIVLVFVLQFIIGSKHLEYGFNNDDWYVLAWYQQVVDNPIHDLLKAWREIGPHNFAHAYYIGPLFEVFKFNYPLYHIFNSILKALSALSIFPLIYLLFRNRFLAFLTTILFAFHFTPFGGMNNVLIGEDSLMLISINLFLTVYIWASQRHQLGRVKILSWLLVLLLAAAAFDITRSYPFLMALPLIEAVNFLINRSSTSIKISFLRLLFLYAPFLAVIVYSPHTALNEFSFRKLTLISQTGNYQLYLGLFASFGSTFVPIGIIDFLGVLGRVGNNILYANWGIFLNYLLFRYFIIVPPLLLIMGLLTVDKVGRFVLRTLSISTFFSVLAFMSSNYWLNIDPKLRAGVDPGTYFIPGLIGLFVFSTSISFFIEWLKKKDNYFLLTLSLSAIFSLLYTFLTWILVGENAIFTGVHGYLSVAAIGSSSYLATLFYLAYHKLISNKNKLSIKLAAAFVVIYFFIFFVGSYQQVDNFYAGWLINGFKASEQQKIQDSFWKEVGFTNPVEGSPTLIYLDGSQDYDNGYFYSGALVWDIPAMLTVRRGEIFDANGFCKTVILAKDIDKIKIETIDGKQMITQTACGDKRAYNLDNFWAFKMINRDLVPIKAEILKQLGAEK